MFLGKRNALRKYIQLYSNVSWYTQIPEPPEPNATATFSLYIGPPLFPRFFPSVLGALN